jgi:peptidase M1-like protein
MLNKKIKLTFSSLRTVVCCILLLTLTRELPAQMQSVNSSTIELPEPTPTNTTPANPQTQPAPVLPASQPSPAIQVTPTTYWQQEVHYDIHVTLNDIKHSLKGDESFEYINHSPDTLTFIYIHLWPNAYKNNSTALYRQLSDIEERKSKLKKIKEIGYINQLAFTVNGIRAPTSPHPQYEDIVKLLLPSALLPNEKITIATPFFVRIPSYFSRLGHEGQSFMITQWYPKPAVYDKYGWHEMPYLDQGEFYSEFGSFKVQITLPAAYVVGATGVLQTNSELEQYKKIGRHNHLPDGRSNNRLPDARGNNPSTSMVIYRSPNPKALKTLEYFADSVHDFAWFADRKLTIDYDTLTLRSGRIIDVFSYYRPGTNRQWRNSVSFIKDAVLKYSKWVGEYAYPVVSTVEGPGNTSSGGMEYPMITLITSPHADREELDGVIAHEVGHNWFYGMLGSNEREHPWMDEGITTFYEFRYEAEKYRSNTMLGSMISVEMKHQGIDSFQDAIYHVFNQLSASEPIETPASAFPSEFDYGIVVYTRAAAWLYLLEKAIGKDNFERGMQNYFSNWKFKHPYPADLKSSLEQITHSHLDSQFDLLHKTGPL